jgi:hypothetical protein
MRRPLTLLGFVTAIALQACTSPAVPWCEKQSSCNNQVQTGTCETYYNCVRSAMLSAGGNCAKIQNDQDALASCEAGLACSDLSTAPGASVVAQKCNAQYGALAADEDAYATSCQSVGSSCNPNGG